MTNEEITQLKNDGYVIEDILVKINGEIFWALAVSK